ncbi:MFS transporter [Candidatus Gottesmanbacteria bacterium]|nr:MFS transporter [Candidatus Gottesmanbacteria bacterium]
MLTWLSKDGKIIFLARAIRSFAFGFISIIIGIYLKEIGLSASYIGILLSSSIFGGALFSILVGRYAVKHGLKTMFLLSSLVSLIGIALYILSDNYVILILASLIAFISPSGKEMGPFLSLEQAYLSFTSKNKARTFSFFNITSNLAITLGSLLGFLPSFLQNYGYMSIVTSFKTVFILYLLLNLITLFLYSRISEVKFEQEQIKLSDRSKKIITKLFLLFGVDSFAGGFVISSIVSLWFHTKFALPLSTISVIFFVGNSIETVSYYLSGKLAERFGLINTMVFTHIPSSIFLILMPFMPTVYLAIVLYFLRILLSEMDIPARQAYVVSVVEPQERSQAASITTTAKLVASSISPSIATNILLLPFLSPFVIAGSLKILYDLSLLYNFRRIRPLKK